jgi:hypothetical protein
MNKGKKEYYAGLNIGFWNSKGALLTNGDGMRSTCFPSLRGPQHTGHIHLNDTGSPTSHNLKGFSYGETARTYTGVIPENEVNRSWIESDLYADLIRGVMHQLQITNGCIVHASFSLPYDWMEPKTGKFLKSVKSGVEILLDVLEGQSWSFTTTDGEEVKWSWGDLSVLPEDVGFLIDEAYSLKGQLRNPEILNNSVTGGTGGHTSGLVRMIDGVDVPGQSGTFAGSGMWSITKELQAELSGLGCEVSDVEASLAMEKGFFFYKGKQDIRKQREILYASLFHRVASQYKTKVDLEKVPSICVCGGGGKELFPYFEKQYKDSADVWLPKRPIIGAAVGQAKLIKFGD